MLNSFQPGWQFFEDLHANAEKLDDPQKKEKAIEAAAQLKSDYITVFTSDAGKRVLADLEKRYVTPDILQGYFPDGVNTAINMAVRATEVRMVKVLLTINKPGE